MAQEATESELEQAPQDTTQERPDAKVEEREDNATTDDESQEDDGQDWRGDFDPNRAMEKIRKQNGELRKLRDRTKQAEQRAEGVEDKDARISELEKATLRYEVAFDLGLPKELAKRLAGSTKEELLADAEDLMKLVGGSKPPSNRPQERLRSGGDPAVEPEDVDLAKIASRMFRN